MSRLSVVGRPGSEPPQLGRALAAATEIAVGGIAHPTATTLPAPLGGGHELFRQQPGRDPLARHHPRVQLGKLWFEPRLALGSGRSVVPRHRNVTLR